MAKKVLITGASGYIGGNFLNFLKHFSDYEITGLDKAAKPGGDFRLVDLGSYEDTKYFFEKDRFDVIFHFAGILRTNNFYEYYRGNVLTTQNILENVKDNKNTRIFLIGTADQYGNLYAKPICEDYETRPVNHYGLSKKVQEEIGFYYFYNYSLDIIFLRIFNVYGEDQPNNFIVPKFIDKVFYCVNSDNKSIEDIDLEFYRDFIFIEDLQNILEGLIAKAPKGEVINIGSGVSIDIKKILKYLCKLSQNDIKIIYKSARYKQQDIKYQVADISKLKNIIGSFQFTDFFKKLEDLYSSFAFS